VSARDVPVGMPGEFERMLGLAPELAPDPRLQKIFDDMRGTGDQSMSDRKLPPEQGPEKPAAFNIKMGVTIDDKIEISYVTPEEKIALSVTFDLKQAELQHENFGKLLDKIRPRT